MQTLRLHDDVYDKDIVIVHTNGWDTDIDMIAFEKEHGVSYITANPKLPYGWADLKETEHALYLVFYEDVSIGTIVHECTHAQGLLFEYIQMNKHTRENTEAFAYYTEFLVRSTIKALKRFGLEIKL